MHIQQHYIVKLIERDLEPNKLSMDLEIYCILHMYLDLFLFLLILTFLKL